MRLPRVLARFNRVATNRVLIRMVGRRPFGVIHHVGRSTGRRYQTVIFVFPTPQGFVVVLTYGASADWVKNVLAAGRAELDYRESTTAVVEPTLTTHEQAVQFLPRVIRAAVAATHIDEFLMLRRG
jgi:deazaflavin-dependent oxidoreductase (nitroreductase family)